MNATKPQNVLQFDDLNREIANESKISFQVKIPIQDKTKYTRVETAEGQLIESNQLLKTINMSGVLSEEYSP